MRLTWVNGGIAAAIVVAVAAGVGTAALATGVTTHPTAAVSPVPSAPARPGHNGKGPGGQLPGNGNNHGKGDSGAAAHGSQGTVTAITGTSLTLRTILGTATVTTTATTTVTRAGEKSTFSAIHTGDVLDIKGAPSSTSTPATPTVAATSINIHLPEIAGRVESVTGNAIVVVQADGQEATITTTATTEYYSGTTAAANTAVTVGAYISAAGTQSALHALTAEVIHAHSPFTPRSPSTTKPVASPSPSGTVT